MDGISRVNDPKRVVEEGYDRVAHEYASLEGESEWPGMRWLRKLLERLEPGSSVLDLGCGPGNPEDVEIAKTRKVTGMDISRTQVDLARRNVPAGHFLRGDVGAVQFRAGCFDAIVSFYTVEHIPRREHRWVLGRIYRWLRESESLDSFNRRAAQRSRAWQCAGEAEYCRLVSRTACLIADHVLAGSSPVEVARQLGRGGGSQASPVMWRRGLGASGSMHSGSSGSVYG